MKTARAVALLGSILGVIGASREARADDAIVTVGGPPEQRDPEPRTASAPIVASSSSSSSSSSSASSWSNVADDRLLAQDPELRRSPLRIALSPTAITTGKGFGYGIGVGMDMGSGSVGGRLSATWLRGEGKGGAGESTPTGDSVGLYSGEITLDLHKRGPVHPVFGMGAGFLRVGRTDGKSGYAGMGTGRFALEYALGLDDADVRVGGAVTGGVIGPIDDDVRDLRAYALADLHLAIGF